MTIRLPSYVNKAIDILQSRGHSAYAVGGCVRDCMRGKQPDDWDICTCAKPHEIAAAFSDFRVLETGVKHGTLTVIVDGASLEITTFRVDGEYKDSRHPENVTFTDSLELDLSRRDFTVNAMAYAPEIGLIDPFGGQNDLEAGIIRCVGDAALRFEEDALRILRALRFASVLSFEIEEKTAAAILNSAHSLTKIAPERLNQELTKLLCGKSVREVLAKFRDVIAVIIPELRATFDFEQRSKYHIYDVWEHTLYALSYAAPNPVLRLVMLFHDAGKPLSFTQDPDGTGHFYGHPEISHDIAKQALTRLRYDNGTIRDVCRLVKYHDDDIFCTQACVLKWLNKLGETGFQSLLEVKSADNLAQSPEFSWQNELAEIRALYSEMRKKPICYDIKSLAVNGDDLIAAGIKKGPGIRALLNEILSKVISGELANDRGILLDYVNKKPRNEM